jgi:tetratricopeptide (TPR) repeat protein
MRHLIITILICVAHWALGAPEVDPLTAGRAALERGDLDQAVSQFERAVAASPRSSDAHYCLGMAYGRQAQKKGLFGGMSLIGKVRDEFSRAVELDPNSIEPRLALIDFYVIAPRVVGGSADKALEQAGEVRKRSALDGHRAYARIYTLQKKTDLAVHEMVEAVRAEPRSPKAHYFLGNALLNREDWKGSLHEYEMALSFDAAYMPAYFRIGQHAARSESNYPRGEEALRKYLKYKPALDEPESARAWYWLGMIQDKEGRKTEARQSYSNAGSSRP